MDHGRWTVDHGPRLLARAQGDSDICTNGPAAASSVGLQPASSVPFPHPVPHIPQRLGVLTALLSLFVCLSIWARTDVDNAARELWMSGYVKLEEAGKAEESGNPAVALQLFRDAHAVFLAVQKRFPDWNPSLLAYRLNFCTGRIKRLEGVVAAKADDLNRGQLVSLNKEQAEKIQTLTVENLALSKKLQLSTDALARARREAARSGASADEMARLTEENAGLTRRNRELAAETARLEQTVARLKDNPEANREIAELKEKQSDMRAKLLDLGRAFDTYRRAYDNVKKRLKETTIEREKLTTENEGLRKAESARTKQASQFARQIAEAGKAKAALENRITELNGLLQTEKQKVVEAENRWQRLKEELAVKPPSLAPPKAGQAETNGLSETTKGDPTAANGVEEILKLRKEQQKRYEGRIAELITEIEADRTLIASLRAKLDDSDKENQRLNASLDTLQKKGLRLTAELGAVKRLQADIARSEEPFRKQLEDVREQLQHETAERKRFSARSEEQLAMLRRQEESIAKLEAERDRLRTDLDKRNAQVEEQQRDHKTLVAKTQVVDGLAASLKDADSALVGVRQELRTARRERDDAKARARETAALLEKKDKALRRYEALIAKEGAATKTASEVALLTEQVREANRLLESERERRSALEAVLAKRDQHHVSVADVEAPAISSLEERDRRARDEAFIVRGLLRQGIEAEKKGNIEAARWNYEKVLEHDAENVTAVRQLGLIAASCGDDDATERLLRRAFRLNPDDPDILLPLGFALIRLEKPDLAISMLTRAVALYPENAALHRCLGVACSTLGWSDAAETQFRRALTADAKDSESAFNLAVLLASRQPPQMDEARKWYAAARKAGSPGDPGLDQLFEQQK